MNRWLATAILSVLPGVTMAGDFRGYKTHSLEDAQALSQADGRPVLLYLTDSKS